MKKTELPQKRIGQAVREIGQKYRFKVDDIISAITKAMKGHRSDWGKEADAYESTVRNYLYRSWPQMPRETTIAIISEAFEILLSENQRGSEAEKIRKAIAHEIRNIYHEYKVKHEIVLASGGFLEYFSTIEHTELPLFVCKHFNACVSLSAEDIEFWNIISGWDKQTQKKRLNSWSNGIKINFPTVFEPAFQQWITIRSKNYTDFVRKKQVDHLKTLQRIKQQFDKITDLQAVSILAVAEHYHAYENKRHPLGPPEEIDLLILFKYFLSGAQQTDILEKVKKEHNKAAGDH